MSIEETKDKFIRTYLRTSKGEPKGVLIAKKADDGIVYLGYSLCCKEDKFVKQKGLTIAMSRIDKAIRSNDYHRHMLSAIPDSLKKILPSFIYKCTKYFKVSSVIIGYEENYGGDFTPMVMSFE